MGPATHERTGAREPDGKQQRLRHHGWLLRGGLTMLIRVPTLVAPSWREVRRDWKRPPRGWSPQGGAGIAYTGNGVAATSSTAATSKIVSVTPTVSDTVLVAVALAGGTSPIVSGDGPNSYTLLVGPITNTDTLWIFGLLKSTLVPDTTITISWTTSARYSIVVDTCSRVTGFGVTTSSTGSSTAPTVSNGGRGVNSWTADAMLAAHTTATWSATTGNLRRSIARA